MGGESPVHYPERRTPVKNTPYLLVAALVRRGANLAFGKKPTAHLSARLIVLAALTAMLPGVESASAAQLVINEIMQNPSTVNDSDGEWFELYNPSQVAVDINGWTIRDSDPTNPDIHVITNGGPLLVPPGGFLVLGINDDLAVNGGVPVDYVYDPTDFFLANSSDEIVLLDASLTEVDRVDYDGGPSFPDPTGASMELARDRLSENHLGASWREAHTPYGDGDLGTPGAANRYCVTLDCYYETVDLAESSVTRRSLHAIIEDHVRTGAWTEAGWAILEQADEAPGDTTQVLDLYKNDLYTKGTDRCAQPPVYPCFRRAHAWPSSYGFPKDTGTGHYPRSDFHAMFLADAEYRQARSTLPFDSCGKVCLEEPTVFNNGQGGSFTGIYPGDSNWHLGSGVTGTWETWTGAAGGRRGDVARALFYMDVRYDGSDHIDGMAEPDLILSDDRNDLTVDDTNNQDPAYMGVLATLLAWHDEDPPDVVERSHNQVIYENQMNRNPFVDHPEWVRCVYLVDCQIFVDGFESGTASAWSLSVP
jgi:endonuclease I